MLRLKWSALLLFVVLAVAPDARAADLDSLPLAVPLDAAAPALSSMAATESPTIGIQPMRLLINATTDETMSVAVPPTAMAIGRESAVYVAWGSSVTVGVVEVETSVDTDGVYDCSYSGTWAILATVTFSGTAPKQNIVNATGIYSCLRTRISTAVDGTGVSTFYLGN